MNKPIYISEEDFDEFDFSDSECHIPIMENGKVSIYVKDFYYRDIEIEEAILEFENVNSIQYTMVRLSENAGASTKYIGKSQMLINNNINLYPFNSGVENGDIIELLIESSSYCIFTQL